MKSATGRTMLTAEDFMEMIQEHQKADLIDGVIHMASPESVDGNRLGFWIARLLGDFVEEKEVGDVFVSRVAFRLSPHQMPEPDIAFVRSDRLHLIQYGYINGPPDIAFELVSPESVDRDYEVKKKKYQEAGVLEYWIIDEHLQEVTLWQLQPTGAYLQAVMKDGRFESVVLPGFYLRPEWLWAFPFPKKSQILAKLLNP